MPCGFARLPLWSHATRALWTRDGWVYLYFVPSDAILDAPSYRFTRVAAKVIWGPARALETGQFFLAASACV